MNPTQRHHSRPSMRAPARTIAPTGIAGELAAVSCTAGPGGLRFSCATREGFDRCEALRRERKVERCTFGEVR